MKKDFPLGHFAGESLKKDHWNDLEFGRKLCFAVFKVLSQNV